MATAASTRRSVPQRAVTKKAQTKTREGKVKDLHGRTPFRCRRERRREGRGGARTVGAEETRFGDGEALRERFGSPGFRFLIWLREICVV
jgi:stalled ribosome alternative rescue factor ArfA